MPNQKNMDSKSWDFGECFSEAAAHKSAPFPYYSSLPLPHGTAEEKNELV
jgi:hypothetical protein